jgi:hypothetical protein
MEDYFRRLIAPLDIHRQLSLLLASVYLRCILLMLSGEVKYI